MPTKRLLATLLLAPLATVLAQPANDSTLRAVGGRYYGPRFGITAMSSGVVNEAKRKGIDVASAIVQVGWSWEQRFVIDSASPLPMTQFALLVGGTEQGVFLPSLTWLIGVRGLRGGEFGFGPNVSLAGVGMAFAAGVTTRVGALYVPFDMAIVVGNPGPRVSLLTGFNMRQPRD